MRFISHEKLLLDLNNWRLTNRYDEGNNVENQIKKKSAATHNFTH
jgi:hypothetical protein